MLTNVVHKYCSTVRDGDNAQGNDNSFFFLVEILNVRTRLKKNENPGSEALDGRSSGSIILILKRIGKIIGYDFT